MARFGFGLGFGLGILSLGLSGVPVVRAGEGTVPKDLGGLLEGVRKEYKLPGMAAAVVAGDRVIARGVAGVRELGKEDKITLQDRFPIGSCTKRLTALMIGRLVDAGTLSFDTTLEQALPDVPMRDEYRKVTLAQLLHFRGGIQPYTRIGPRLTPALFALQGTPAERREKFVRHVLQEEPVVKPGSEERYSNASYVVAAQVASRLSGRDFETLMRDEAFKPLGMTHAGFGRPRSRERPNEPWLHLRVEKGFEPEPAVEKPAEQILAAAGVVHCSVGDLARLAAYELAVARGQSPLLKPATARRLDPDGRTRAGVERATFGGSPWLTAGYVLWPKQDMAVVVAINAGAGDKPCEAVFKAVRAQKIGPEK